MYFKKELEDLINIAYEVQAELPGPDRDYYRAALKRLEEQKDKILKEIEKIKEEGKQMNGLEKIETANKFDTMSDENKQKVYDKFGKDFVDDEISRCKTVGNIISDKYGDALADNLIDLFVDKKENIKKSDEILEFIRDL